jgi:hypothetical protein
VLLPALHEGRGGGGVTPEGCALKVPSPSPFLMPVLAVLKQMWTIQNYSQLVISVQKFIFAISAAIKLFNSIYLN